MLNNSKFKNLTINVDIEFLAIMFIIIMGSIGILFLFVVMMLNVK